MFLIIIAITALCYFKQKVVYNIIHHFIFHCSFVCTNHSKISIKNQQNDTYRTIKLKTINKRFTPRQLTKEKKVIDTSHLRLNEHNSKINVPLTALNIIYISKFACLRPVSYNLEEGTLLAPQCSTDSETVRPYVIPFWCTVRNHGKT